MQPSKASAYLAHLQRGHRPFSHRARLDTPRGSATLFASRNSRILKLFMSRTCADCHCVLSRREIDKNVTRLVDGADGGDEFERSASAPPHLADDRQAGFQLVRTPCACPFS